MTMEFEMFFFSIILACDDHKFTGGHGASVDVEGEGYEAVTAVLEGNACTGCHSGGLPPNLATDLCSTVVGVASGQATSMMLIEAGSAEDSYLYHKVAGTHLDVGGMGDVMPPGGSVSADHLATLESWINAGASCEVAVDTGSEPEETAAQAFCALFEDTCGSWTADAPCEDWYNSAPSGAEGASEGATQACYDYHLNVAVSMTDADEVAMHCTHAMGGTDVSGNAPCTDQDPPEPSDPPDELVGDADNGELVVSSTCMGCHTANPDIENAVSMTDEDLINLFDNGQGYMPAQNLTEQEKLDVIAYLRQAYG
ncbi:MAG: hypothetical protein CMK59_09580 [Proteobacteria bacterium]|nr:hypothetical protein [Pseudomonadota bacterium]